MRPRTLLPILALTLLMPHAAPASPPDGNRLAYLDAGLDPYYPGLGFPKLITPQWVGEEGVEAVVVLAIDDMREPARYEQYLRPILDRLKRIDGRAPVSIMTCDVDPKDPQLQSWLLEGLSIEVHTLTHPCPLLQKGDFRAARDSVHGCIDLLGQIPGNTPVAFRMPCCDSLNTPSPRFFEGIADIPTPKGNFLSADSSVFNILTPNDPDLPRELVLDADGRERFRKYLPFKSFVNTIEDYPYPYVIGRRIWEFPCVVPSDWEAQNLHKPNNPKTVEDLKAALDAVVLKQGTFNLVFHPHGWIKAEQVVELIDHAVAKHGRKVKFLTFREALDRLNRHLLGGQSLRVADGTPVVGGPDSAEFQRTVDEARRAARPLRPNGSDNGIRLLDLDRDGYLDVVVSNPSRRETRRWDATTRQWMVSNFPVSIAGAHWPSLPIVAPSEALAFGVLRPGGRASLIEYGSGRLQAWTFDGRDWVEDRALLKDLPATISDPATHADDRGLRLRDLDLDGICELLIANGERHEAYRWAEQESRWSPLPFALPEGARFVDLADPDKAEFEILQTGGDAGLRLIDLDEDRHLDVVFSDDRGSGIYLFDSMEKGWSRKVSVESRAGGKALPPIRALHRDLGVASNAGFWVHSRSLWWQNEDTASLPDLVDRRSFNDLLKDVEPRAKSPEASRDSIRVRPGFRVELVAAEPLVRDPIAFDWSPDGRLWVVEMGDYPLGEDGKGSPGGRVVVLEDADGDGQYDKSTVFLDGLGFPNGVMCWRGGVLISCAPDILYAEDADGDGKADRKEVLFTGFNEANPQHRVNGFALGLDCWVYAADGEAEHGVKSLKTGQTIPLRGRDLRFRPDEGLIEPESGRSQFGRQRDDWGDWFGNNNSVWGWHIVLDDPDLRRNPSVPVGLPWRLLDGDRRLYPISRTLPRFNDFNQANQATSANSPSPYRDDLFGPAFARSLFVSEPVHNLVHRIALRPDGPTWAGGRAADEAQSEFLASSDHWSRFTQIKTGPDGALWVADMYRAVIEHPEWIPDDWEARIDLRAGHDMGRIYRVVPVGTSPRRAPRLDKLDPAGLAAAMDSPNGWVRDTCQRLLLHAADKAVAPRLRDLVKQGEHPQTRVQAIATLDGLGCLAAEEVGVALKDKHPEVRRFAARKAATLASASPEVATSLLRLSGDDEPRVRFAVSLALGEWDDPRAGRALASLLRRDGGNAWMRTAVLLSARSHAATILTTLFSEPGDLPPDQAVESLFVQASGGRGSAGLRPLLEAATTPKDGAFAAWQFGVAAGLLESAGRSGKPLDAMLGEDSGLLGGRLDPLRASAREKALDDEAPEDERRQAVRLLAINVSGKLADEDRLALKALLSPQVPSGLQSAAVDALGRGADPRIGATLLDGWKSYSPSLRAAVLDAVLGRASWSSELLSSLEDGCIPPAEIGPTHRRRLTEHADESIRERARAVFAGTDANRRAVVDRYRAEIAGKRGDPQAGAAVFARACAQCHRLKGQGHDVGPDLGALNDRTPESLLIALLDPNRAVEPAFTEYAVAMADGRVLTGLVAAETSSSVTLRRAEQQEDVLPRSEVEALNSLSRSLMPEGLENDLSPQDIADVIAYVASSGPPPKQVEGNEPAPVRPAADGSIVLPAAKAELFGSSLTFEPRYGNLGWWSSPDDRAAWELDVAKPGRYEVWLDWACHDSTAGNAYVLSVNGQRLEGKVGGTGTWDDYQEAKVGEIILTGGRHRLEFFGEGELRGGALIDLRAVRLRPR